MIFSAAKDLGQLSKLKVSEPTRGQKRRCSSPLVADVNSFLLIRVVEDLPESLFHAGEAVLT